MAPLERAIALAEMDRLAVAVAEDLKLDMARIAEIFFHIDGRVAERRLGLAACLAHQRFEAVLGCAHLHAAPAAARRRLDDHRIADLGGNRLRLGDIVDRAVGARHQRQAQRTRRPLRLHLVAHNADMLGLGADEDDVVVLDDVGEFGVLAQKTITGMDRVGAGDFGGRDDIGNVEIAFAGGRRADANRFVGEPHMHCVAVRGRMHRDRLDPHFMAGAVNAQRDLAAISDQEFGDLRHFWLPLRRDTGPCRTNACRYYSTTTNG